MRTNVPLKTRHREILSSIVREYIETGEPIGSRTISRRRSDALSPASIRNAMADLADEATFRSRTRRRDGFPQRRHSGTMSAL